MNTLSSSKKRTLTLVVDVLDEQQSKWIWDAHKNTDGANGVKVRIIATGDQVTKPGELVDAVAELDAAFVHRKDVQELVDLASEHLKHSYES